MARHRLHKIKLTVLIAAVSLLSIVAAELGAYCPDEEMLTPSLHANQTTKVTVKFINNAGIEVSIYWVNFDAQEIPYQTIKPGRTRKGEASFSTKTFPFHAWSVRATLDGLLLATHDIPEGYANCELRIRPCLDEIPYAPPRTESGILMRKTLGYKIPTLLDAVESLMFGAPNSLNEWKYLRRWFPRCDYHDGLGEEAVPGFYVLCMRMFKHVQRKPEEDPLGLYTTEGATEVGRRTRRRAETTTTTTLETQTGLHVAVLTHLNGNVTSFYIKRAAIEYTRTLLSTIRLGVGLRESKVFGNRYFSPPFALYTTDGMYRVTRARDMLPGSPYNKYGTLYFFETGNFMWPGVKAGHVRTVFNVARRNITMTTLSLKPLVFEVQDMLYEEECNYLIRQAIPNMKNSSVKLQKGDEDKDVANWRTSTTHIFKRGQTNRIKTIERRVRDFTRIPLIQGESPQIVRYLQGQHYHTHHDYFDPERYNDDETAEITEYGAKNRFATVFWYLNDVPEGGETNFPMADGNFKAVCEEIQQGCPTTGLSVKPEMGKMLLFYNMLPDGSLDVFSLHAGCDVGKKHVKWGVNKWLWNKQVGDDIGTPSLANSWFGDHTDEDRDTAQVPWWHLEAQPRTTEKPKK